MTPSTLLAPRLIGLCLLSLATLSLGASTALAQTPAPTPTPAPAATEAASSRERTTIRLAVAVLPGETPGLGEFYRSIRIYDHWSLDCETYFAKRRVCAIDGLAISAPDTPRATAAIIIANTPPDPATRRSDTTLLVETTPDIVPSQPQRIRADQQPMPLVERGCNPRVCFLQIMLDAGLEATLAQAQTLAIEYTDSTGERSLTISAHGLREALAAANAPDQTLPQLIAPAPPVCPPTAVAPKDHPKTK